MTGGVIYRFLCPLFGLFVCALLSQSNIIDTAGLLLLGMTAVNAKGKGERIKEKGEEGKKRNKL